MLHIPETIAFERDNNCNYNSFSSKKITISSVSPKSSSNNAIVLNNTELPGFCILAESFLDNAHTVYVIDPRGFIVEISSKDILEIITDTWVINGLIQTMCVWIHDINTKKMKLVSVKSNDYQVAKYGTDFLKNSVFYNELSIGDKVQTKNAATYEYMGVMNLYGSIHRKKPQLFKNRIVLKHKDMYAYATKSEKLLQLEKTQKNITLEDSIISINQDLSINTPVFYEFSEWSVLAFSSSGLVGLVSKPKDSVKITIQLNEISKDRAIELFELEKKQYTRTMLALGDSNGKTYLIKQPGTAFWSMATSTTKFEVAEFEIVKDKSISIDAFHDVTVNTSDTYGLDDFCKFYEIRKYVDGLSYV